MAPYAIAHLKIGLKLYETGYLFGSSERARVYLTNALEPAHDFSGKFDFAIPALAHEAHAVNEIKKKQKFTVVIGNPPYSNFGRLNKIPSIIELLADYKHGLGEKKLNLDDDFIKFVRFAQYLNTQSVAGIVGLITNHVYIDGLTHRRMRQSLLGSFQRIDVLDLHGSAQKRERAPDGSADENVFDIKQGVAIAVMARFFRGGRSLRVGDLFGTRESKYAALAKLTANSAALRSLEPEAPNFFFRPEDNSLREEYETWWSVPVAMPFYNSGLQTKRDELTIHHRREDLERVLSDFRSHDTEWLRRKYELGPDGRDWTVALAKKDVRGQGKVIQLQYRPFDFRFTYFTGNSKGFLAYPRRDVSERILAGSVALVTMRQIAGVPDECEVFVTRVPMTDRSLASTLGTPYLFPLMSMRQGEDPQQPKSLPLEADGEMHNFSEQFLAAMRARLGNGTQPHPMTILNYMYGIFHSPSYRSRYSEFLKIAFPRFPLPSSLALFGDLARLGGELVTLHLMESTKIDNFITAYIGPLRPEVKRVSWSHDTVWLDATATSGRSAMPGTIGFRGVPEAVWNFRVGGYKVCERWLKDRKDRTLSKHDIAHYQKIIVALAETIRLMNEIDQVIEAHGGWPGAFDGKVEASRARKSEALA